MWFLIVAENPAQLDNILETIMSADDGGVFTVAGQPLQIMPSSLQFGMLILIIA